MITKIKLAFVAAALAGGCPALAQANEVLDTTTGLRTELYDGPLQRLERQGAPISDRTGQHRSEHSTPLAYRGGGFDALAQAPRRGGRSGQASRGAPTSRGGPAGCTSNQSNFGGSGSPSGPYCFEN